MRQVLYAQGAAREGGQAMATTVIPPVTFLVLKCLAGGLDYRQTAATLGMSSTGTASKLVQRVCESRGQTPKQLFADIASGRLTLGVDGAKVVTLGIRQAMLVESSKAAARKRGGGPCRSR